MGEPSMLRDTCMAFFCVSVNLFCWHVSGSLVKWMLPKCSAMSTILAARLVCIWASIVAVSIGLGLIGMLSPGLLYAMVALLWLAVRYRVRWAVGRVSTAAHDASVPQAGVQSSLCRIDLARSGRGVDGFSKPISKSNSNAWVCRAWIVLVAIGLAQIVQYSILTLPFDWDTLAYHLPLVDSWIQTGSITSDRVAYWYVPGNNELLALWFAGLFSGDYWSQLNNVPIVFLLVHSTIGVLIHFGVNQWGRLASVVGMLGCTPVLRQITSVENDVAVGALLVAGALFAVSAVSEESSRSRYICLVAIVVGLLAGIKYYALGYAIILTLAIVMAMFAQRRDWRSAIWVANVSFAGFSTLGAPWYVRNWILGGTPLYPKGFSLLGMSDPWADVRPELAKSCLLFASNWEVTRLLGWAWFVQGGLWLTVSILSLIPLAGAMIVLGGRVRRRSRQEIELLCLGLIGLGSLCVYLLTPNVIETQLGSRNMLLMQYHSVRFGFAMSAIASVILGIAVQRCIVRLRDGEHLSRVRWQQALVRTCRVSVAGTVAVAACTSLVWVLAPQYGLRRLLQIWNVKVWLHSSLEFSPLNWALLTMACLFALVLTLELRIVFPKIRLEYFVATLLLAATPIVGHRWHRLFDPHFHSLTNTRLNDKIAEHSNGRSTICVCKYRCYPTYGSTREQHVWRPLFLHSPGSFDEQLKLRRVSLVVVPTNDRHWSSAYEHACGWLESELAERFELVGKTGELRLFKLRQQVSAERIY